MHGKESFKNMIAILTGKLIAKQDEHCIIDINGVGYHVSISLSTLNSLPELNQVVTLHIHTYVREDQLVLYGFQDEVERATFLQLISISGVGPRMAKSILSNIPANDLSQAIRREDLTRLTAISGVGKKTAERIIIELKDKIISLIPQNYQTNQTNEAPHYEQTCSALTNLGYTAAAAADAVRKVKSLETLSLADAIKHALKELRPS